MIAALKAARNNISPCRPPFWARTGHLQTVLGHLLPSPGKLEQGQEFNVTLENESERIHSTYLKGDSSTVVYLFHGLGGSAEADYMRRSALVARSFQHHVFINNHRGCGDGVGLATEPYHSGRAEDLSKVIAFGRKMFPDHGHVAVGFSLSANALLLLAAKVRAEVLPDVAICINGPIQLDTASIKLTEGLNKIYNKRFVLELKNYITINRPQDINRLKRVKDLRDFDEIFTAPVGGFINRADYYKSCSSKQFLNQIAIPTVLMTAEDDPFVSSEEYKSAELSPSVILHMEKYGGHMGYLTTDGLSYKRWLDMALKTYFQALSGNNF